MRSAVFAAIVVITLLLSGLVSAAPRNSAALGATPTDETPTGELTAPPADCTAEELTLGDLVEPLPPGDISGVVAPFDETGAGGGRVLYLAIVTLLPDSCLDYRYREGAVVLFVQQGTIVYTARADAAEPDADAEIMRGDSDASDDDNTVVALDTPVTLHGNDWITQNKGVWFALRNSGDDTAVISVAVYAVSPWSDDACTGVCRKP
ncbi:MAG: hypothetical protein H0V00_08510 [Chloroflexia bacterium]|nr:hypothetical protein [Chloroflexia bacterium]